MQRAIDSVLCQTFKPKEIIVVDDGSDPPLESCLEPFYLSSIVLIRNHKSRNAAYSRNLGAESTTSEYLAFLDSDDFWAKEHIEHSLADMEKSASEFSITNPNSIIPSTDYLVLAEPYTSLFTGKVDFRTSGFIIARTLFEKNGGFDADQAKHQDWDLALRLGREYPIVYRNACTIFIDSHAEQRMSGRSDVRASLRFLGNHYKYMSDLHISSYLRFIASFCCLTGKKSGYVASKALCGVFGVDFGSDLKSKILWYCPLVYRALSKTKRLLC